MTPLVITATGTEIGKTIVTAAVTALAMSRGERVAVVKPAQTGIEPGDEADVEVVSRLSGNADVHELARYPEPLAPATAAARAGVEPLSMLDAAAAVRGLADRELVIVEGAGGLLVRLDRDGRTVADVAAATDADVLVVVTAGLGTLNQTALTCEAIRSRGLRCRGIVIGRWPSDPDLAAMTNLGDLPSYAGAPLLGALPDGAGSLPPAGFLDLARASLAPEFGGTWVMPGLPGSRSV